MDQSPDTSRRLTDEQKIQLIDSMRNKGSYEAARERLTATARIIADRVSAAIPGQTWKFTEDPAGRKADREGLSCKELTGDIARRPIADAVIFGTAFSAEDFKVVTNIVREEAAKYGATTESSLFNESAKRDYDVQGNAGRTRGCLLRSTPETSRRLRSQIRESPDSPGRFSIPRGDVCRYPWVPGSEQNYSNFVARAMLTP